MNEIDISKAFNKINLTEKLPAEAEQNPAMFKKIAEHKAWLQSIPHEHPSPNVPFKIGVYIRYFNQTKYENYIEYHKQQFIDTIKLCPKWTLVDFYIDEGGTAPYINKSPELSRLMADCEDGVVNLIITQKISNFSKDVSEVILCSRLLAASENPIGIYFISEDIYTLSSYLTADLKDKEFLPSPDWQILDDSSEEKLLNKKND